MTTTETRPVLNPGDAVGTHAARTISRLQNEYLAGTSRARAALARLRRCNPLDDADSLTVWDILLSELPEQITGHGESLSRGERAVLAAGVLYAVHQQSKSKAMHVPGARLGQAVRRLANPHDADSLGKPVMRRFNALITANSVAELMRHLRGLVQQFRDKDIPLDYARLAKDLYFLQYEQSRTTVRIAWSRDLTRARSQAEDTAEKAASGSASAD